MEKEMVVLRDIKINGVAFEGVSAELTKDEPQDVYVCNHDAPIGVELGKARTHYDIELITDNTKGRRLLTAQFDMMCQYERVMELPYMLHIEGVDEKRPWESYKGTFNMASFEEGEVLMSLRSCGDITVTIDETKNPKVQPPMMTEEETALTITSFMRTKAILPKNDNHYDVYEGMIKRFQAALQEAVKK